MNKAKENHLSKDDIDYIEEDLCRAGILSSWWVINSSLSNIDTTNLMLCAKANNENIWINQVLQYSNGKLAIVPWRGENMKGAKLRKLL